MTKVWKTAVLAMTLGALTLGAGLGCSTNDAATQKCKGVTDSKECAPCCKKNGASGHATGTVNGKFSCSCMGGG
jgi:hypothetical protein